MSKRRKKVNEDVNAVVDVTEVEEETKEETEMTEKKGFINGLKELGNKVPKPVKVVGGILVTGTAAAFTAVAIMTKLGKDKDESYIDCDLESENEALEAADEAPVTESEE